MSSSERSMLTEGKGDHEALLRYINPDTDWRSYNKVMINSVSIWKNEETQDVAPGDLQILSDFLYTHMHEALSQDYTIVTQPGPGVMRAAFAITEAEGSAPVMDTVTSIIPQTRILTGLKGYVVGGKPGFVGTAGLEAKLTDSQSGKILGLAVDRRGGTKDLSGMTDEWNDVEQAYIYWAANFRYQLVLASWRVELRRTRSIKRLYAFRVKVERYPDPSRKPSGVHPRGLMTSNWYGYAKPFNLKRAIRKKRVQLTGIVRSH